MIVIIYRMPFIHLNCSAKCLLVCTRMKLVVLGGGGLMVMIEYIYSEGHPHWPVH